MALALIKDSDPARAGAAPSRRGPALLVHGPGSSASRAADDGCGPPVSRASREHPTCDPPDHIVPPAEKAREMRARAAELIRRAVLTMAAEPNRERAWLACRSSMPAPVRDAADQFMAGRYDPPRAVRRFTPTPRDIDNCLDVLAWLTWLKGRAGGEREVKILVARAYGIPFWQLSQRFGKSENTLRRWEAAGVAAVTLRFWAAVERMG